MSAWIFTDSPGGEYFMSWLFPPPAATGVPVIGSDQQVPVHRIYCVGKNYAAHVVEMGSDPSREPPCFFLKPTDAIVLDGVMPYPPGTRDLHYEGELVLAIGKGGKDIRVDQAHEHIFGYASGLDMTRRDLQKNSGKLGQPWDTGKAFDHSAPISAITPVTATGQLDSGSIRLWVNGELRQEADISQLIWKCSEIISQLSRLYTLLPGDLVFTGTPAGVGPVVPGDEIVLAIHKLGQLKVKIGKNS
jgi:fumarylpyruvate hydrolase